MVVNAELEISDFHKLPLSSFILPDNCKELIYKVHKVYPFVVTVGDFLKVNPIRFSTHIDISYLDNDILIDLQKQLLNKKLEIKTFIPTLTTSKTQLLTIKFDLPGQYQKLIKKISLVMYDIETMQDIINIDVASFSKLPYVGKSYVNLLTQLQNYLVLKEDINKTDNEIEEVTVLLPKITFSIEQLETPLNQLALSLEFQKLIKKISVVANNVITVQDIINVDLINFSLLPNIGRVYINQLIEFKKQLPSILVAQTKKSALFNDNYLIDFNDIDNILIADVESYLWTLNEMKMDVALSRWGFNKQNESF